MAKSATSRDREEYARRTARAREELQRTAVEVSEVVARQVAELIVEGDVQGGRSLVAGRLREVASAELHGDEAVLRAAWLDLAVAAGACAASIDLRTRGGAGRL